jgi:tetratricopeptide (TPR) repeat protein
MDTNNEKIISFIDGEMNAFERAQFREELKNDSSLAEDFTLQIEVNKYMKQFIETEELLGETEDKDLEAFVHEMLKNRPKKNELSGIRKFVASGWHYDTDDLTSLHSNSAEDNPDTLTRQWVEEWYQSNGSVFGEKAGNPDFDFVSRAFHKDYDETRNGKSNGKHKFDFANNVSINTPAKTSHVKSFEKPRQKIISLVRENKMIISAIAAAAIIILFAIVLTPNEKPVPGELFADYYKPFERVTFVQRNADGSVDRRVVNGIKAYNDGNYTEATDMLSALVDKGEYSAIACFYNGLAQMESSRYNRAIEQFEYLLSNYYVYGQEATWYMALCHLKTGNTAKTKALLRELSKEKGIYREKSVNLLRKLD